MPAAKRSSPSIGAAASAAPSAKRTKSSPPSSAPAAAAKSAKAKPAAKAAAAAKPAAKAAAAEPAAPASASTSDVVIDISKVCDAFKTRAAAIVKAVAAAKPSARVAVNAHPAEGRKPDRGSFVVAVRGAAAPIVELRSMVRPFVAMKALNMDDVSARVVAAL